jgi:flagellar biosynthesis protein FliQ
MSPEFVVTTGRQALELMLVVSAPLLLVALAVGLIVSILQAVTQINEATLSFVPKIIALSITLVIAGPWMLNLLVEYIQRILLSIPSAIG